MHATIFVLLAGAAAAFAAQSNPDPTVCAPGTGFFQSCSNGFRGCCQTDACSNKQGICPPVTHWSKRTADAQTQGGDPTVCAPGTGFFQSCSNGFRGCCKTDACSNKQGVCPPASGDHWAREAANSDPTVCQPGTGFFQSCANGFRGCCKKDACSNKHGVCPI